MRRVLFGIVLFTLILAACAPAETAATQEPSYPSEPSYPAEQPADLTPAELAVIKQLAESLGLQESEISLISSEETEFGDACLGVAMEGVMCAQVITPGRVIVLEANGVQYEYHTSEDGSRVQPASLVLVWKREGGIAGFCDILTVFRSGEVYSSNCSSQSEGAMGTLATLLTATEQKQFHQWITEWGEVKLDASDPKGVADGMVLTLDWFGTGSADPSESEQQELFTFAQDVYQELRK